MKEIIFVGDPMCSWCWGFAPVLEALEKKHEYKLSLLVGGLRSKGDSVWDEKMKRFIRDSWREVESLTKQPFDYAFLEKREFLYDTTPSCRALVTMQELQAEDALAYFHALQEAFYMKGRDITKRELLAEIAQGFGLDRKEFLRTFDDERILKKTLDNFSKARTYGVNSFPSLIVIDEQGHLNLIRGYRSLEEIERLL